VFYALALFTKAQFTPRNDRNRYYTEFHMATLLSCTDKKLLMTVAQTKSRSLCQKMHYMYSTALIWEVAIYLGTKVKWLSLYDSLKYC